MSEIDYKKHWAFDGLTSSEDDCSSAPKAPKTKKNENKFFTFEFNIFGIKAKNVKLDVDCKDDIKMRALVFGD